jgi:hypothetical protein
LIEQADGLEREARALADGLSDAQGNWQPLDGRGWSVAQCLDHLAKIHLLYSSTLLPDLRAAATPSRSFDGLRPGWLGRKFIESQEPPPRRRFSAPPKVVPASNIPLRDAVERFVASHDGYREMVRLAAGVDANRVIVRNPFLRLIRMKLSTVLLVLVAHDRRHVWQAAQVRKGLPPLQ